jgi:hypothetical protein
MDDNQTVICQHQENALARAMREGESLGQQVRLTEAERVRLNLVLIASIDATPEQKAAWARQLAGAVFHIHGMVCDDCGHRATGPLTQCAPEDIARWTGKVP